MAGISIEFLIEMACNISENFVFAYLGISVALMIEDSIPILILVGLTALNVSRFVSIWVTTLIINIFRKDKLPFSYCLVMTWGGLRGAIPFYLALNIHSS